MEVPSARLLIVDDEPIIRESLSVFLQDKGYRVDLAPSGQAALELTAQHSYQLAIVDIRMPDLNGIALLRELKVQRPELPVLMMTAFHYDKDHIIKRSRLEGLEGVVFKKPVDPERLRQVISEAVAAARARRG